MKRAFLLVVLLMLSVSAFAQTSAIPPMMNFQGHLAKPDGTNVPDGNYQITFSIFAAATGGTPQWTQTMNPVMVHNGVFAVLLGNGNPLTADMLNGTPYLQIQVGVDNPLPRQQFASVAFAFKANTALTVPDGAITMAKINSTGASAGQSLMFNGSSVMWGNPKASDLILPFTGSLSTPGNAFSVTNSGNGAGIFGRSDNGYGLSGNSNNGVGVYGLSTNSSGVQGMSSTATGTGGISASGYGVYGISASNHGVVGNSADGYGIYGVSKNSIGVQGTGTNQTGVYGLSTSSSGVQGMSSTATGTGGTSVSGYGVYGISASNHGVVGNSTDGYGVYGTSKSNYGIFGTSVDNIGISGF